MDIEKEIQRAQIKAKWKDRLRKILSNTLLLPFKLYFMAEEKRGESFKTSYYKRKYRQIDKYRDKALQGVMEEVRRYLATEYLRGKREGVKVFKKEYTDCYTYQISDVIKSYSDNKAILRYVEVMQANSKDIELDWFYNMVFQELKKDKGLVVQKQEYSYWLGASRRHTECISVFFKDE